MPYLYVHLEDRVKTDGILEGASPLIKCPLLKAPVLVFDVDGTICPLRQKGQSYEDIEPYFDVVARIREYKRQGFIISFDTARNMGTHENNLGKINCDTLPKLIKWLDKWEIPYDELHVGKCWPRSGFIVDDKAIRPDEFMKYTYEEILRITGQSE